MAYKDPEEGRRRRKARYGERVAQGLCTTCGDEPRRPGKAEGEHCAQVTAARLKEQYYAKKAQGICVKTACNEKAELFFTMCPGHRAWNAQRMRDRAARLKEKADEAAPSSASQDTELAVPA